MMLKRYNLIIIASFFLLLTGCFTEPSEGVDSRIPYVNILLRPTDTFEATYTSTRYAETGEELGGFTVQINVRDTILTYYESVSQSSNKNTCTKKYTSGNSWDSCECVPSKEGFRHDPCQIYGDIKNDLHDYDAFQKEQQLELLQDNERMGSIAVASFETAEGSICYIVTNIRDSKVAPAQVTIEGMSGYILPDEKYSSMRTSCFAPNGVYLFDFGVSALEDPWPDSEVFTTISEGGISVEYALNDEVKNKVLGLRTAQGGYDYLHIEANEQEDRLWERIYDIHNGFSYRVDETGDKIYRVKEKLEEADINEETYQKIEDKLQILFSEFEKKEEGYNKKRNNIGTQIVLYQYDEAETQLTALEQDLEEYDTYLDQKIDGIKEEINAGS